MAFEPHYLLIHADLIREDRDLSDYAAFIRLHIEGGKHITQLFLKLLPVFCDDHGRAALDESHIISHFIQLFQKVALQILTLFFPGLHEIVTGEAHCLFQRLPKLLLILFDILHRKDIGKSRQNGKPYIVRESEFLRHLLKILHIFAGKGGIVFDGFRCLVIVLKAYENVHLSPLHVFLHHIPDISLEGRKLPRKLYRSLQISVVYRLYLYREFPVILCDFASAEACHALYHLYPCPEGSPDP